MKKQLCDKEKAKLWDDLPNYITVSQPNIDSIRKMMNESDKNTVNSFRL